MKKTKFAVGDKVFGKIKGYPNWPAKIDSIEASGAKLVKYNVTFYETGETAILKEGDICNYNENKALYGKLKLKNKRFNEAIKQIEMSFIRNKSQTGKTSLVNEGKNDNSTGESVFMDSPGKLCNVSTNSGNYRLDCSTPKPSEETLLLGRSVGADTEVTAVSQLEAPVDYIASTSLSILNRDWLTDDSIRIYF